MDRGIKTVISFFIFLFSWGCMLEESSPEISSSGEQPRNGLALFFEQKLNARLLTRSGELEILSNSHTPLMEYVCYGYSAVYGGHYFIVPLRQGSTGQIDAALVYPLTDGDDLTLSGDLDTPLLLDESALNAVPDSCRFLLSNKFLSWKKEGLSVSRSLYAYAESLDGKVISTIYLKPSFEVSSNSPNSTMRTTGDYPYEAEIYIHYEMQPYVYGNLGGITISVPSMEARRNVFVSTFEHLEFVDGVGACELTAIGSDYLHLEMEVAGDVAVTEAVQLLMLVSSSQFQSEYHVEISAYSYDYALFWWDDLISEGSGGSNIGGGNSSGGSTGGGSSPSNPGGESGSKSPIELMDATKFVAYEVSDDCFEGCTLIMQNYGVPPGSRLHVYRLLAEDEITRELFYWGNDPADNYTKAIACIDRHLDAIPPRPIIVGLNESPEMGVNEGTTDHFVVITGRGYDESKEMYYYTYMETGVSNVNQGCDTENNRLYYDAENLTFRGVAQYREDDSENKYQYDVIQVRPNDGKNLNETESYELINE